MNSSVDYTLKENHGAALSALRAFPPSIIIERDLREELASIDREMVESCTPNNLYERRAARNMILRLLAKWKPALHNIQKSQS